MNVQKQSFKVESESDRAAKRMLDIAGVSYRKIPAFEIEIKKESLSDSLDEEEGL